MLSRPSEERLFAPSLYFITEIFHSNVPYVDLW